MSSQSPKNRLFEQLAVVGKAIGHASRLELLESLGQGERGVDSLAERAGLTVGNASQHLQQLRRAGLVTARRQGKQILYRLTDDTVVDLLSALGRVAERNMAEMQQILDSYFNRVDELEPVSRDDLVERMRDGLVTLLDVRPEDEFAAGHLPGAVNIPLADLEARLTDLDSDREIVAYCRGPYCVLSVEAVARLRALGFRVRRFEAGLPEWAAAGLTVERTALYDG